jgi:tetratricopeptide (TPR) repeat protein
LCLRFLAERAASRGDRQQAEQYWREAFANGEARLAWEPEDFDTCVSLAWAHVEFFNRILRPAPTRLAEAETLLRAARQHGRRALQQRPGASSARDVLASIDLSMATTHCRTGDVEQAISLYRQAVQEIKSLCAAFPWTDDYWRSLRWFHQDLVSNLREVGQIDEAQRALHDFAAWIAEVEPTLPADPRLQERLREARRDLVRLLQSANLTEAADGSTPTLSGSPSPQERRRP